MNPVRWLKRERSVRRAEKLAKRGAIEKAMQEIESSLEKTPEDSDLLLQKAWLLLDLKRFSEAIALSKENLKKEPEHPVFLLVLGEGLYGEGRYEEARDTLHQALEITGENLRVEYVLGLTYVALGDLERASRLFEDSIRYDKTLVQSRLLAMAEHYLHHQTKQN